MDKKEIPSEEKITRGGRVIHLPRGRRSRFLAAVSSLGACAPIAIKTAAQPTLEGHSCVPH